MRTHATKYVSLIILAALGNCLESYTLFYKNLFYKNVQTKINQNFKNILRTYSGVESVKNIFILLIFLASSINKGKRNVKL